MPIAVLQGRTRRPEVLEALGDLVGVAAGLVEVTAQGGAVRAGGSAAQVALQQGDAGLLDGLGLAELVGDQVGG